MSSSEAINKNTNQQFAKLIAAQTGLTRQLQDVAKKLTDYSTSQTTKTLEPTREKPRQLPPSANHLRREDIGRFDPHHDDPLDIGVVIDEHIMTFTDVDCFVHCIKSFLRDSNTATAYEGDILSLFETLLSGPAAEWWNSELTEFNRRGLRATGLSTILATLTRRFALEPLTATAKFNSSTLTLQEIAIHESRLVQFIQRKLRYARAMGMLADNNTNWYGTMIQIWSSFSPEIRLVLQAPSQTVTLNHYMRQVEEARPALLALAARLHPDANQCLPPATS
ncbi:hypothetical protein GGS26DRAFT_197085 [Hypomontagnella submonticulosa]|nr:hypothetical protein GGS26DRAFT_197085 [Hypomontagnella submonticulosa]